MYYIIIILIDTYGQLVDIDSVHGSFHHELLIFAVYPMLVQVLYNVEIKY